jgi:hypothetical protein
MANEQNEQAYDPQAFSAAIRRWVARGTRNWDLLQVNITALSQDSEFREMFLGLLPETDRRDFEQVILDAARSRNALLKRLAAVLDDVSLWPRIEAWAREHDPELCTVWERFQSEYKKERGGDA